MGEECCESKCPLCSEYLDEVFNCGFYKCSYSIRGAKMTNGKLERVTKGPFDAPDDKLLTFKDSKDNIAEWCYLKIKVDKH